MPEHGLPETPHSSTAGAHLGREAKPTPQTIDLREHLKLTLRRRCQRTLRKRRLRPPAARRDAASVQALLERGADVNARQSHDYTALHTAAANGDRALADVLLTAGADRKAHSADGKTPAAIAEEKGHAELAAWLRPEAY